MVNDGGDGWQLQAIGRTPRRRAGSPLECSWSGILDRKVPLINNNVIGRGRKVAALVVALAAAPVVLSAVAHADPDPDAPADPRAQCEAPDMGGVFIADATSQDGVAHSECRYIIEGHFYYDNYENGTYTGTLVYSDGAKVPTERPQMPEVLTVPGSGPIPLFGP
jgi:hypothetical protein